MVFKKKDKDAGDADAEPVQINAMSKGTVVEFDLNKHIRRWASSTATRSRRKEAYATRSRPVTGSSTLGSRRDIHFSATPSA